MLRDLGVLVVRVTVGGLLAGHGSQKLFGWFGGHGLEGTGGSFEGMGFRPGRWWASLASASELGGGLLTAVGFLNPVGPLTAMGSMLVATFKAHRGKPIWVTEGGAELPVTNLAVLGALALAGPGRLSLDGALGTRLPRWTLIPGVAAVVGLTWWAIRTSDRTLAASAFETESPDDEPIIVEPVRIDVVGDVVIPEQGQGAGESDQPQAPTAGAGVAGAGATAGELSIDDALAASTPATPDRD